jgi:hypothetical protein
MLKTGKNLLIPYFMGELVDNLPAKPVELCIMHMIETNKAVLACS